ncbi:ABC transporter ATP-binding protein [Dictyobacter arantiisoli]|uniref:ABC transporter ATP-binding protein n=1 Tax=Dictyobacter arantiisoli TaxID=2014874 RepID=A0A5A5T7W1_9CHLR|nr:ABC transporter ATP-binding protein [Dictyobacter arantiisoli]GCF07103.1 ABC transporter ATP-binding protein [Dictyobacter arantiisoli]
MSAEFVLEAQHLRKYYHSVHAVEDISLHIKPGEIFGFLGPNGAGKTTTIGMILGLIKPTAGSITVFGDTVTPFHNTVLRRVGTMMGAPSMLMGYSARQNLRMLARLYPQVNAERIEYVLKLVGLKDVNNRPVKQFSTGMKQRLGLALALLGDPDLLILDEPTNGMDPVGMHEIRLLLRDLASQGKTVFISSHLLHEMQLICDRVAIVRQGTLVAEGSVVELLARENTTRVKTADPNRAAALCKEIGNGSENIRINGVYVDIQGLVVEQIVEHLVQGGLTPTEVFPIQNNLENVFLQLAQGTTKG